MPGPLNFDAFLGWVNVTDPNNIPPDARVLSADDLLRYEKLGVDATTAVNEIAAKVDDFDSDTAVAESLALPESATRAAVKSMVDDGVEQFQTVIDAVPGQVDAKIATDVPAAVATAIAADGSIVAATVAAVDAEVQGRDFAEMPEIIEDDIALAIVDEDGRRLWLESGYDAKPTDYSAGLIVEKIGPAITAQVEASVGVEDMNSEITELAFVIVDEDGRKLVDAQWGTDGRFTQAVIDSISSRLTFPAPPVTSDPTAIVFPSSYPMVVGKTYKVHPDDIIRFKDLNHRVVLNVSEGTFNGTVWTYTPTTAKTFNLTVKILDRLNALVKSLVIPVTVYAAPSGAGKRHMGIGDSITRAGTYVGNALTPLTGAVTVGTRTYNDGVLNVEGRGGWSLDGYMTRIGNPTGDSPFLFPTTVAGNKFLGNTSFWKAVVNTDPNGYDFQGFQKIARGWGASNAPFQFDANGYPTAPTEGDVVVDPLQAAGQTWRQYTAGAWTTMAAPAIEFSFSKYMQRYAAAFPNGGPTSISLMLETNDFFNALDDASFTIWKNRMDTVIASIRAWSATVPFIICLAPTGGPVIYWSTQTVTKFEFDDRMKNAGQRILAAYDTTAARANKVYVTNFLGAVTPEAMADWVHPHPAGHEDMSAALSGTLAKLITEGA